MSSTKHTPHALQSSNTPKPKTGSLFLYSLAGLAALGGLWLAGNSRRRQRRPNDQASGRSLASHGFGDDVRLESRVTIDRPPEEVYRFWRDFRNLPRVMHFVESVEPQEGNITHWTSNASAVGPRFEWDAELVDDEPGRLLSWRSLEGSDLQTWGTVIFRPTGNGSSTHLEVKLNFSPHSRVASKAASFLSQLEQSALTENLRNLKKELESGEPPVLSEQESLSEREGGLRAGTPISGTPGDYRRH